MSLNLLNSDNRKLWLNPRVNNLEIDNNLTVANNVEVTEDLSTRNLNWIQDATGSNLELSGHFRGTAYYKGSDWAEFTQASIGATVNVGNRKNFTVRLANGNFNYNTTATIPITCAGILSAGAIVKVHMYLVDSNDVTPKCLSGAWSQDVAVGSCQIAMGIGETSAGTQITVANNAVCFYCEIVDEG